MKKRDDFYDDGRTIAHMDIEGMPFHDRKPKNFFGSKDKDAPELTKKEQRQVIFSGMLAGVLLASVFIVAAAIFLLILFIAG